VVGTVGNEAGGRGQLAGPEILVEMFPRVSRERLQATFTSSHGDVATAVAMLMSEVEPLDVEQDHAASQTRKRIREAIGALRDETKETVVFHAAAGVLLRIISNILKHPGEHKFRKVLIKGKMFAKKVGLHSSSRELLEAAGFEYKEVDGEQCVVHTGSDAARLYISQLELEAASNALPSSPLQSISTNTHTI